MDEAKPPVPPELLDEAMSYVDGRLSDDDKCAFEQALQYDELARAALIEVLTVQSMVDIAGERSESRPEDCTHVRTSVGAYYDGELSPMEKARFAKHADHCESCRVFVEAYVAAVSRPKESSRKHIGAMFAIAAVALAIGVAFVGVITGGSGTSSPQVAVAPPTIPLDDADLESLRSSVLIRAPRGEVTKLGRAVDFVRQRAPEFFEGEPQAEVARVIAAFSLDALSQSAPDETRLLAAYYAESRVATKYRARAFTLLSRLPGSSPAEMALRTMEESEDPWLFRAAACALGRVAVDEAMAERVIDSVAVATPLVGAAHGIAAREWHKGLADAAKSLCKGKRHALAAALLNGAHGEGFWDDLCETIAAEIYATGGKAVLEAVAAQSEFASGKAAALRVLERMKRP